MKQKNLISIYLYKIIFVVYIFIGFILQFTVAPKLGISHPLYFLFSIAVCISMFEKEYIGMFFGLLCGALWDMASPFSDGIMTLYFGIASCLCGLITHYLFRNTLLNSLLLTFSVSLLYSILVPIITMISKGIELTWKIFLNEYFPSVIISIILTIPTYLFVKETITKFKQKKSD